MRAILLDIEGTTTPVDFVYGTLFPFARDALPQFLADTWNEPHTRRALELLRQERASELGVEAPSVASSDDRAGILAYLLWLMGQDRKSTALKLLQGMIWEAGYRAGTLRGEVYPDVAPALQRWKSQGVAIHIFSSGSVLAQKLIFGHSTAGDLTPLLSHYFDTETGPKRSSTSYSTIAERIGVVPEECLFLSDVTEELSAASEAGMQVMLVIRPGNKPTGTHSFASIETFQGLL